MASVPVMVLVVLMVGPLVLAVPYSGRSKELAHAMEEELNHIVRHHNFVKGALATGSHDWHHGQSLLGEDGRSYDEVEDKIEKVKLQLRDLRKKEEYLKTLRHRMRSVDSTKSDLKKRLQHVGDGIDAASSTAASSSSVVSVPAAPGTGAPEIVHLEEEHHHLPQSMGAAGRAMAPQVLEKHHDNIGHTVHFQDSAAPVKQGSHNALKSVHENIRFNRVPQGHSTAIAHVPQVIFGAVKTGGGGTPTGPHAPQVVLPEGKGIAFHASQSAAADNSPAVAHAAQVVVPNSDVSFVSPAAAQSAAASKPTSDHSTVGHAMNIHASTSTVQYDSGNRQLSPKVGVPIKIGGLNAANTKGSAGVPIKIATKATGPLGAGQLAEKVVKQLKAHKAGSSALHTHELEQLEAAKSGALKNYRNYAAVSFQNSAPDTGSAKLDAEASTAESGVTLGSAPGAVSSSLHQPAAKATQLALSGGIDFGDAAPSVGNALDEASKLTNMIGGDSPGLPRMDV